VKLVAPSTACALVFSGLFALSGSSGCGSRTGLGTEAPAAPSGDTERDAGGCPSASPEPEEAPAYLEIVLDGSESMKDDNKWSAATLAFDTTIDRFGAMPDARTALGLEVFSDLADPTAGTGPYPTKGDVAPAFVDAAQRAALRARIDGTAPAYGTPTLAALSGAYSTLRSFTPSPPIAQGGVRVAVLLSDGAPGGGGEEKARVLAAVIAARQGTPQIRTMALGIGPFPVAFSYDYDATFMGMVANAGGTAPSGCDPAATTLDRICHHQITPGARSSDSIAQDILAAFTAERAVATITCSYLLAGSAARLDPASTRVTISQGTEPPHVVPRDPVDGWDLDDPRTPSRIVLRGASCRLVTETADLTVDVAPGCR
jgi:hypothetical protein